MVLVKKKNTSTVHLTSTDHLMHFWKNDKEGKGSITFDLQNWYHGLLHISRILYRAATLQRRMFIHSMCVCLNDFEDFQMLNKEMSFINEELILNKGLSKSVL